MNTAEVVGLHNGTVCVPTYNWTTYLSQFYKKLRHLKGSHHFNFLKDHPGVVLCKEYWSSAELAFNILQSEWNLPQVEVLPSVINPKGINRERAEDLYKEIREFCRPGTEDLVAPEVNN